MRAKHLVRPYIRSMVKPACKHAYIGSVPSGHDLSPPQQHYIYCINLEANIQVTLLFFLNNFKTDVSILFNYHNFAVDNSINITRLFIDLSGCSKVKDCQLGTIAKLQLIENVA